MRKIFAFGLVIIVVGIGYGWSNLAGRTSTLGEEKAKNDLLQTDVQSSSETYGNESRDDYSRKHHAGDSAEYVQFDDVELEVEDFEANSAEDQLVSALSREESAWLRARGYPSSWELAHLDELDWEKIDAAWYGNKDPVAAVLRGERFLRDGDLRQAAGAFRGAAGRGSLYGEMRSGLLEAQQADPASHTLPENPYLGFRMAAMLAEQQGDHQASEFSRRYLAHLRQDERDRLDRLALGAMLQYSESWRRGMVAIGKGHMTQPVIRPGVDQWRSLRQKKEPRIIFKQLHSPFVYR